MFVRIESTKHCNQRRCCSQGGAVEGRHATGNELMLCLVLCQQKQDRNMLLIRKT